MFAKIFLIIFGLVLVVGVGVLVLQKDTPKTQQVEGYSKEGNELAASTVPTEEPIPTPIVKTEVVSEETIMHATFHTNKGDITIEFLPEQTPNTVDNFVKLAKSGFYDGVKFHRVIAGFMIQGGDPLSKDDAQMPRWGTGGPGYMFDDEISATNRNDVGTISMANAGPDTNGSQFFINVAPNNFLDSKHTVFGKVAAGMDVVTAISQVKTLPGDRPVEAVVIKSISLE